MESESHANDTQLRAQAEQVLANLANGDVEDAVEKLLNFNDARNDSLYQQIGKITRGLHDAIIHMELNNEQLGQSERDVQARLRYVIDLTASAANRTMDLAEEAMPIATALNTEATRLQSDWEKLGKRELSGEEFRRLYERMSEFLGYSVTESNRLYEHCHEIVLAQGYQDLSGQIISKIMDMLKRTEHNLVHLLAMAGSMHSEHGLKHEIIETIDAKKEEQRSTRAEGPLPDSENTLKSQDEVDDLLSSLGF
ncbi:MAG: protein phosphatase CheZ [Pseudomonadales bacterium]|nr:protein phosphatase CheZ [Pseudomonadales bacterium]